MAGSWKRTITTPFRKACTILGPQHPQQQAGSSGDDKHASTSTSTSTTKSRRRHGGQLKGSAAAAGMEYGGEVVEMSGPGPTSTQLYGDVMSCGYEDVQVMWSMLDNKARVVLDATS